MPDTTTIEMPQWSTLVGHEKIQRWFGAAFRQQRFGGSFLLVGAPGIGKRTVAKLLAQTLLCESVDPIEMAPCGVCEGCVQAHADTHPDIVRIGKPEDKSFIPLESLIGPPDARMQSGFCRDVRMKPFRGERRVAILEDADFLNEEGANCLLKTLEEPPSGTIVLLIGTSEQKQLPTIRSRSQIIRMGPLTVADATRLLREVHQIEASDEQFAEAIDVSGGDMQVAARLLDEESGQLRQALTSQLAPASPDPVKIARLITTHVDQAGKEASKRRGAMRDVFSIAVQHFRRQMREEAFQHQLESKTLARLDRSIRALREVDRSANQTTLIECYAADIAMGTTGDRGDIG
ncbi:MAG: ATP-binding protein [Rubripirellula sp.]